MSDVTQAPPSASRVARPAWLRFLVGLLMVPAMFLVLGAASFIPADTTVSTWSTSAQLGTWTGGQTVLTSGCPGTDAACMLVKNATYTSPSSAGSAATYYVTVDCSGVCSELAGTIAGQTVTYAAQTAPQYKSTSVTLTSAQAATLNVAFTDGQFGQGYTIGNVKLWNTTASYSGGGASGSLTFPLLDLASISSNVGLFFSFMSPLLWILLGIGVAGIILARARNFV